MNIKAKGNSKTGKGKCPRRELLKRVHLKVQSVQKQEQRNVKKIKGNIKIGKRKFQNR